MVLFVMRKTFYFRHTCMPENLHAWPIRAGTIQSLSVHDRSEVNRYVSIRSSLMTESIHMSCTDTSGSIISHLTFIQLSTRLEHSGFDLIMLN